MRGIATIDRQPGDGKIAIWITSRQDLMATHVNAVEIGIDEPDAHDKVRSLTRMRAVLVTDGSSLDGLPIEGEFLAEADILDLVSATETHQQRVLDAIAEYKRQNRTKAIAVPTFPKSPNREAFVPQENRATYRAFSTANYLSAAWSGWLKSDAERQRRTVQPRTEVSPWMMPADMNDQTIPDFPASFAGRLNVQPLV